MMADDFDAETEQIGTECSDVNGLIRTIPINESQNLENKERCDNEVFIPDKETPGTKKSKFKHEMSNPVTSTNKAINSAKIERDNNSQTSPLLRETSYSSSYGSFEASSSTSEMQSPSVDGASQRPRSQSSIPDVDDLREKLREFLDTPRQQWMTRRMMSGYALGQTIKTIFVSGLVSTLKYDSLFCERACVFVCVRLSGSVGMCVGCMWDVCVCG